MNLQKIFAWANSRAGFRILMLLFVVAMAAGMAIFDLDERFKRVSMCAFFCAVLYFRDHASEDRWLAIAIMAGGTLLSLVWSL